MTNKLLYNALLPILICFISFSSVYLNRTEHPAAMLAIGAGLFISILIDKKSNRLFIMQLFFLFMFHWLSQLNWCISIYLIVLIRQLALFDHALNPSLLPLSS
ncbi:hypothetical protein [Paenibacillus thermotolerans]|uniref:hypothetical protein n=1 Tax=Paenibacillus thermotolerans TaxID=3027807 RepID=UPI002367DC81|nr:MULTISPECIES: hypothetical protein [unclassified Paenibacillus]